MSKHGQVILERNGVHYILKDKVADLQEAASVMLVLEDEAWGRNNELRPHEAQSTVDYYLGAEFLVKFTHADGDEEWWVLEDEWYRLQHAPKFIHTVVYEK